MQRSVDGFIHRPVAAPMRRSPLRQPLPVPQPPAQPIRKYAVPELSKRKKKRVPTWLQMPLIIAVAMVAGFLASSPASGQLIIVLYGIGALIWRIPSRTTFTLALLSMVATIALLVGRSDQTMAQNFATYTFLLLVAGVVSLGLELRKEGGRIYSIRQRDTNI